MPAPSHITHKGKVVSIDGPKILVEILSESACASCQAKGFCSLSEQKKKQIEALQLSNEVFEPGEEVLVLLRSSLGIRAVWIMYIIPLLFLLATLFLMPTFGIPEWLTGILALGAPLLWYSVIWLFRNRIKKDYIFVLEKLINK